MNSAITGGLERRPLRQLDAHRGACWVDRLLRGQFSGQGNKYLEAIILLMAVV
jgi:hypothetical protein